MRRPQAQIDAAVLNDLLSYDPLTGQLTWKARSADWFTDTGMQVSWNKRYAGKPAFTATNSDGYKVGAIESVQLRAHRIAWILTHGQEPEQLDHVNGDRADNRLANLREVSVQENNKNKALGRNNASGVAGVYFVQASGDWRATITIDGKLKHLGLFKHKHQAVAARKLAEQQHRFHSNHGRSA